MIISVSSFRFSRRWLLLVALCVGVFGSTACSGSRTTNPRPEVQKIQPVAEDSVIVTFTESVKIASRSSDAWTLKNLDTGTPVKIKGISLSRSRPEAIVVHTAPMEAGAHSLSFSLSLSERAVTDTKSRRILPVTTRFRIRARTTASKNNSSDKSDEEADKSTEKKPKTLEERIFGSKHLPSGVYARGVVARPADTSGVARARLKIFEGHKDGPIHSITIADKRGRFRVHKPLTSNQYVFKVVATQNGSNYPASMKVKVSSDSIPRALLLTLRKNSTSINTIAMDSTFASSLLGEVRPSN